jgi:hypothetical protein
MDMQKGEKSNERRLSCPPVSGSSASSPVLVSTCLQDLYYWQKEYYQNCGGPKLTPYNNKCRTNQILEIPDQKLNRSNHEDC